MDGSAYGRLGEGMANLIVGLFILACITIPLAVWKLVDIAIWICHHFSIHWS